MGKFLRYSSYVIRHRWFVMIECFKRGLIWRGLTHDLSKFRPSEFFPYMNHFGGGIKTGRNATGYYKAGESGDLPFDRAWLGHQQKNDHHWQHHCLVQDTDPFTVFEMPIRARKEMLCDWIGAGRAQGTPDVKLWYKTNGHRMILGPETRQWVEDQLQTKPEHDPTWKWWQCSECRSANVVPVSSCNHCRSCGTEAK